MARVVNGRYKASMEEPFVVFMISMRLPLHKDPAVVGREVIRAKSTRTPDNAPTV